MNRYTKKWMDRWHDLELHYKMFIILGGVLLFGTSIAWCASS